jgi:hypothetical protein
MNEEKSKLDLLREKCQELGIKFDGRMKEASLQKLINEFNLVIDDIVDDVVSESKDIEVSEIKNNVVRGVIEDEKIVICLVRGGGHIREYSKDVHGDNWLELAKQFIEKQGLKK